MILDSSGYTRTLDPGTVVTVSGFPVGAYYWSPWDIPYQLDMTAAAWVLRQVMITADLGTGKSHIALRLMALAAEEDEADLALVICKPNKLQEWISDISEFTSLRPALYHGPKRKAILPAPGIPWSNFHRILVTTYETVRNDAVVKTGPRKQLADGPLLDFLRSRRVLIIYDEILKLGNRSSDLYKAHFYLQKELRKEHPDMRMYGMTGTPIERDWENAFSEFRIVWPQGMPTVKAFEEMCIRRRVFVPTGKSKFAGFYRTVWNEDGCRKFSEICASRLLRKRKTDPDVASQFPPRTEDFVRVEMHADQKALYRKLEDLAWDPATGEYQAVPGLGMMLFLLAGHPLALLRSPSKLAQEVLVPAIGDEIRKCSSAKAEALIEDYIEPVVNGQGSKMLVFTFFAETVLPVLRDLIADQCPVFVYDGRSGSEQAKQEFRSFRGGAILLSSDAGSDGINIPEADYVIEYDAARTHSTRMQRFGRADRLGRIRPLTCLTMVLEGTAEETRLVPRALDRNRQQDIYLRDEGAENYMSAADRKAMFAVARKRRSVHA